MADAGVRPDLVLFDLDGTLIQSREAAWSYFEDIALRHDLPFESAEDFYTIFAANFSEGLRAACPDEATFQQVRAEYFSILEREYTPPLVPGMREVVTHLAERTTLAVLSSNALKVVRRVLEVNRIATCIAHVFAGDVNPSKQDVIRKLRADVGFTLGRHCSPFYDESGASQSNTTSAVYLVTDTVGDVEEALAAGAIPIGVSWGMHTEDELRRAGAAEVCLWPQELVALLGRGPVLGTCTVPLPPLVAEATSLPASRGQAEESAAAPAVTAPGSRKLSEPRADRRCVLDAGDHASRPPGCGCACGCGCGREPVPGSSRAAPSVLERVRAANTAVAHARPGDDPDRSPRTDDPDLSPRSDDLDGAASTCCGSSSRSRPPEGTTTLARGASVDPELLAGVVRTAGARAPDS